MYISKLEIENFRVFNKNTAIEFNDGINVIIGHNNSGKTTILDALDILFNKDSKKSLGIEDFNKDIQYEDLINNSPIITISASLSETVGSEMSKDENNCDYSEDLITVSKWLTRLEEPYEARITYKYYLPEKYNEKYIYDVKGISEDRMKIWNILEQDYINKYIYKVFVGDPGHEVQIDRDDLKKFDFQSLSAIRDVERDMLSGKNKVLKDILDFFLDYEIKIDESLSHEQKQSKLNKKRDLLSETFTDLTDLISERLKNGKKEMLGYVNDIGATYDGIEPDIIGQALDSNMYSLLNLVVKNDKGFVIPIQQNGLGYNNLIYISLLLAKMQKNTSEEYMGSNKKVYSILVIEEPEAHLHSNLQYKFLKFLKENKNNTRQTFITTHSPNITASVNLDSLIVLSKTGKKINCSYPAKVFNLENSEDVKSKKYIERFLDVTKADMFFANSLIFVEGLGEQILLPEFSRYEKSDFIDNHTSIINVGGRYFSHFLKLFNPNNNGFINKKVAVITDLDPQYKDNVKKPPIILLSEGEELISSNPTIKDKNTLESSNIKIFTQDEGSTLEYQICLDNLSNDEIIMDSMSNNSELIDLFKMYKENASINDIIARIGKCKYRDNLMDVGSKIDSVDKAKDHIIAQRYLMSIDKGIFAQELAFNIASIDNFKVPNYICEAIKWIEK